MIVTRVCSRPAATAAGSRFSEELFTSASLGNTSPRHSAGHTMMQSAFSLSSHRRKAANRSPRRGHAQCRGAKSGLSHVRAALCVCACRIVRMCVYFHICCGRACLTVSPNDATCTQTCCICATTGHGECTLHMVTGWDLVCGCLDERSCWRKPHVAH